MKARKIYEINNETFKIIKVYDSLSALGKELLSSVFKDNKNFYTILNSIIWSIQNKRLYCGKQFIYSDEYNKFVEQTKKDLDIKIVINNKANKSFVTNNDLYKEYVRIKKLTNSYYVSNSEFKNILKSYYDHLYEKLLKDGELNDLSEHIGKFEVHLLKVDEKSRSKRNLVNYLHRYKKKKSFNVVIRWDRSKLSRYGKLYLFKFNKKMSAILENIDDDNLLKYEII